jgi:hypothetical protein
MGSNAVTEEGQLVNLDMLGNRVAALTFGPRHVAVLVGRNKVVPSLEDAMCRVKNIAAPANAMRLDKKLGKVPDSLMPQIDKISCTVICATIVIEHNVIRLQVRHIPVDEHKRHSGLLQFAQMAALMLLPTQVVGREDDQAVHSLADKRVDMVSLPLEIVVGVTDEHVILSGIEFTADASDNFLHPGAADRDTADDSNVERLHSCGRARGCTGIGNEGSSLGTAVDQAFIHQGRERLSDDLETDSEVLRDLALGRQPVARLEPSVTDTFSNALSDLHI